MRHIQRNVLALSALLLGAPSALAALSETVAPGARPPTTKVTVSGTGFAPDAAVDVFFDTTDMCLTFASAAGAVSCVITVPKSAAPQGHWISLRQQSTATGIQKPYTVRTDMAQYHGRNSAHNGVNPFETSLNPTNVADLDVLWQAPIGAGGTNGGVVVASGRVFVAGNDGKLYAFNAATGTTSTGFPMAVASTYFDETPAVGGNRVYTADLGGQIHAYDVATGLQQAGWPIQLPAAVQSPPALALGNIYISCNDGKIYAYNVTTKVAVPGFPVSTATNVKMYGSPTIVGNRMYIGSDDGLIYAFNALNGALITGYPIVTGDAVESTVAAASGMGFIGSRDHNIYGFHLASANSLTGFPKLTAASVFSSPAIAGGRVVTASADGTVYSTATSGNPLWNVSLDAPVFGAPIVANGVVYLNSQSRLYALSAASGDILWSAGVESGDDNSPTLADGILYFASLDGNLYAFSVNGLPPAARLPGGALGVKPALSALKPDRTLKPNVPLAVMPAADADE